MFMLFEFMFPIIFVMVFGMIIFQFVTGIGTWHKNNQSPRLSVSATVVAKRENVSHHSHPNGGDPSGAHGYHTTSSTSYYVTCLLYTSPSPRDGATSRMPSSA